MGWGQTFRIKRFLARNESKMSLLVVFCCNKTLRPGQLIKNVYLELIVSEGENHVRGPGAGRQAAMVLEQQPREYISIHKHEVRGANWDGCGLIETPKPTLGDNAHVPTKPHLLILPKQFHQLGPKHMAPMGGHSYLNLHTILGGLG